MFCITEGNEADFSDLTPGEEHDDSSVLVAWDRPACAVSAAHGRNGTIHLSGRGRVTGKMQRRDTDEAESGTQMT